MDVLRFGSRYWPFPFQRDASAGGQQIVAITAVSHVLSVLQDDTFGARGGEVCLLVCFLDRAANSLGDGNESRPDSG